MSDLRKAAEMALIALDMACAKYGNVGNSHTDWGKWDAAANALRQALAQPEQISEPIYLSGQYVGEGKVVSIKTGLFDGAIQEACHMANLAQPEQGKIVVSKNHNGQIVAVTRQDEDHHVLKVIATSDEPEQEPIAYVTGTYGGHFIVKPIDHAMVLNQGMALYTAPVSNQQPVAWQNKEVPDEFYEYDQLDPMWHHHYRPLYTAPPKREWQGLTDEGIRLMAHNDDEGGWSDLRLRSCWHEGYLEGARSAEAELKDKNK